MAVSCTSLYQRFVIKLGVQLPELSLPHSSLFSKSTACSSGAFFIQQAGEAVMIIFSKGFSISGNTFTRQQWCRWESRTDGRAYGKKPL
jgi:hypothetical protein